MRELVVALSLDSDNFSRNLRTINQQIKEAESTFKLAGAGVLAVSTLGLSGCIVGTVVGTAVDVGVEVVKVPFKVGKGIYDVVKDDEPEAKKD